ncbi:MAG: hypothetical protein IT460_15720 [Planctomycetes bacterium]|nr:hypothetical protein [Planctomycetota bacterium]
MLHKLLVATAVVGGVVFFVGTDVVGSAVRRARESVRASLTSDVPLRTQVAQARAQIDKYAENVIRGEIAAEALADTIVRTEREVAARRGAVERERVALASLKATLEQRGTATLAVATPDGAPPAPASDDDRATVRRARAFQTATSILERREQDLEALRRDHATTRQEVEAAKAAQARLAEEVALLEAEIEALEARTAVAQTRKAHDAEIDRSGYGEAEAKIAEIRKKVREQDRRLEYYARKSEVLRGVDALDPFAGESAVDALRAALD